MTCEISFLQELDIEGGCKERSLCCKAMMERDLILIRGEYGEHFAGTGAQIQMSERK